MKDWSYTRTAYGEMQKSVARVDAKGAIPTRRDIAKRERSEPLPDPEGEST